MQLVPAFRSRRRRPRLIVLAFKPSLVVVFFASDGVMERDWDHDDDDDDDDRLFSLLAVETELQGGS